MESEEQLKLMAAALYEIRVLLSDYLGSECKEEPNVRLAAHLAYGLHNQALAVIDGNTNFDIEATIKNVKKAEEIVGHELTDGFGILKNK